MSPEEILKPDGSLALAGEATRIVATPPHSYAMLTIHYDTGNFASRCPSPLGRPNDVASAAQFFTPKSYLIVTSWPILAHRVSAPVLGAHAPLSSQRPDQENERSADRKDETRKGEPKAPIVTEAISTGPHHQHVVLMANRRQEIA
jgi:hypothetical protein